MTHNHQIITTRIGPLFHVDGDLVCLGSLAADTPILGVPYPRIFPIKGAAETRKTTWIEVASFIFNEIDTRDNASIWLSDYL